MGPDPTSTDDDLSPDMSRDELQHDGLEDLPEPDWAEAMELFGPAAADTIENVWREFAGRDEPLPTEVLDRAVETLIRGGVQGVPGMFVAYDSDPREALASALPE